MKTITLRNGQTTTVKPGEVVVCDINHKPIRVQPSLTSFQYPAYTIDQCDYWERVN